MTLSAWKVKVNIFTGDRKGLKNVTMLGGEFHRLNLCLFAIMFGGMESSVVLPLRSRDVVVGLVSRGVDVLGTSWHLVNR